MLLLSILIKMRKN